MKVIAFTSFIIIGYAIIAKLASQIYYVDYPFTNKIIMLEKIKLNKEDYNPSLHYVITANYGNGSVIEKIVTDTFEKANMYELPPFKSVGHGITLFGVSVVVYIAVILTLLCNC